MIFKVEKKYVTLPVNSNMSVKNVALQIDGKTVYDFDCRLDVLDSDFTAYVDVSRFMGAMIEVKCDPEMTFPIGFSDEIPNENDIYRPKLHFTVKNGWNNDPNGLIYYGGKYHMFYQYNPCAAVWGTMHWGHAVSDDLITWEEKDIALYPDELGAMYSGSAFEDVKGVSGITNGKNPPMLLFYTAAAGSATRMSKGKRFSQCLAYSFDGETFEKYDANPIIPHIEGGNRDPKVVWVEEIGRYILALYLNENRYAFFVSDDLKGWTLYQEIPIPSDWECPDIFPLECDGERYWVLMGARDYYLVGRFTENGYETVGEEKRLSVAGVNYAAQTFSGTGKRVIKLYWQRTKFPTPKITQQMGIPVELSLCNDNGEFTLKASPVTELDAYCETIECFEDLKISSPVTVQTGTSALDIRISADIPESRNDVITLNVFGKNLKIELQKNKLGFEGVSAPLYAQNRRLDLRVIVDTCSMEIYADEGRILASGNFICDYNLPYVRVNSSKDVLIKSLDIRRIKQK